MRPSFRLSELGRNTKILLASVLALAALVTLFDWNWLRRPLERYLIDKSSREVRIRDLHVQLGLEPTVRLRGVYIQNAPWAAKRPFATAGEVSFTVSLQSIWRGHPIVSKLVLVDADVDMERQADGLRNWRLRHPDDRAAGRVKVQTLEAHRSQIRFVNRAIDLDFTAVATPLEKESPPARSGASRQNTDETRVEPAPRRSLRDGNDDLSTRIAFKGTYEGVSFTGEALSAGRISFRESGVSFPLRGHIASRKTRFDFDGFFTDIFDLGPMDAKVRVAGSTLAHVHPFLRIQPPDSRPFQFDAQLTQTDNRYKFAQLRGRIGETDIAGEATYDRSRERPLVLADLKSETADIADLSALVGIHYATQRSGNASTTSTPARIAPDARQQASSADGEASRPDRVFPARAFHVDRLKAVDARINMNAKKLKADAISTLESLRVSADLSDGVLELKPIDVGFAGGHLNGSLSFNGRRAPHAARATIELRDIRLEKLMPALAATARSIAPVRGEIALSGHGNSIAAILGNATGSATARMDGGRISNLADAKLGLNVGKILSLLVRGDRDVDVHCGAIVFDLRNGSGKSQVVLDTEQTRTEGVGTVDLRGERWDLVLTPQPKNPGLFTRRASIRIQGTFRTAEISIQERIAIGRVGGRVQSAENGSDSTCTGVRAIGIAEKGSRMARTQ